MEFPDIVELNVGGRHFTTSLTTLTKYPDSMLATMFSGRHPMTKDKDGRYFIDVSGETFEYILEFLRIQILPPPDKVFEVRKYAEYFGIEGLCNTLDTQRACFKNDLRTKWKSDIEGYSHYLTSVKNQLEQIQILNGYISLEVTKKLDPSEGYIGPDRPVCYRNIDLIQDYSIIHIESSMDDPQTLITVLAIDLKKIGINLCHEIPPADDSCRWGRMFRVDLT